MLREPPKQPRIRTETRTLKYIYVSGRNPCNEMSGVENKVMAQVKAFEIAGYRVEVLKMKALPKLIRVLPFASSTVAWNKIADNGADDLYIRYPMSDFQFLRYLRRARKLNRSRKIVIEVPTYPYEKEKQNILQKVRDRAYRKFLYKYVNRIAIIDNENRDELFHVPCIHFINGIDMSKVEARNHVIKQKREIHVICVANFGFYHGIDRFINGMKEYYGKQKQAYEVILHLVGNGAAVSDLKKSVYGSKIENKVCFHGSLYGEKLNELYDLCDVAIESLGLHRKLSGDSAVSSSLKSREYLAKGIPFIYAGIIDVFKETECEYIYRVADNDDPIDITSVVGFVRELYRYKTSKDITEKMRSFAEREVGISMTMGPIIDYYSEVPQKSGV